MNKPSITRKLPRLRAMVPALIAAAAFLLIAGCTSASNFAGGDAQMRNKVTMIRIPFMISFEKGRAQLSGNAMRKLDNFMARSHVAYGDELSMDFPLQRNGKLSEQNRRRLIFLSELMKIRGLHLSANVTPYGISPAPDHARLLISRYIVTPPQCGDWSQPSTDNYGNAPTPNFGCANQANLGLMVANPRDLITGVKTGLPDAEKIARTIQDYRTRGANKLTDSTSTTTGN
ncbi:MAG: hypothetical protein GXP02_08440 [Alphaproteobacteria bacterium]|nr:hypothetical protein [Alphaproteobacteria bacterium]